MNIVHTSVGDWMQESDTLLVGNEDSIGASDYVGHIALTPDIIMVHGLSGEICEYHRAMKGHMTENHLVYCETTDTTKRLWLMLHV